MPLLGKKSFKPNPLPKDLKSLEEVFVIKETSEVFRSYDEYVNRIILYGFQVWSCELTGKTNLKYGEAVACEEQALKRLESFPKYLKKPILEIVHHSTCALQTLVQQCYKQLKKEFVENEPVECCVNGKWHQGKVSRIHHGTVSENNTEARYDVECGSVQDCLKNVPSGDIKRAKKLPSEEMLKCFIRANTENPWRNDNSPWIVKHAFLHNDKTLASQDSVIPDITPATGELQILPIPSYSDMAKKFSIPNKLNDFSLVLNKTTTPSSKNPTKGNKSSEKAKKKAVEESAGRGKPRVNKTDLSQRKLDSFTKSIDSSFTAKNSITVSLSKLSDKSLNKITPTKKDIVDICSSTEKDDDKTPSGQLRGTPVKCRLVLTPVKSPYRGGLVKSPAHKKSGVNNDGGNNTKTSVVIEDDTNDVIITDCKSPKTNSSKKLKSSPKSGKSKIKALGSTEKAKKKHVKEGNVSKKLDLSKSVTDNSITEKELMKGAESKKKIKGPKAEASVQRGEVLDVDSDSNTDFESSPRKLAGKLKQSSGKMKQTTLLDLTKKPENEKVLQLSPKMKSKKQKTLSEMFSTAFQKDRPNQPTNGLIRKTEQASSSSCLAINLHTPHQDLFAEKLNVHKEQFQRQFNKENGILNRQPFRQKCEDKELVNSKPLPPSKPVNMPSEITAETFGDIAMVADFVHTFRNLLVPRESLYISIDNLSQALVTGNEGFPLLSRILFICLQILLQDRSTRGEELGMRLSEMPLTQQSASEVSRLYLNSKLKMLTSYEDDKQLQGILESLQHEDFYNLTPKEKTKILVILCHEVLSSDAMDNYIGSQLTEATKLRKQKQAKQKEKKDKIREEKERQKKEKEEMEKQKEEEANRKQLKMDELSKKGAVEPEDLECTNSESINVSPGTETSNKTEDCKTEEKKTANEKKEIPTKEQNKEVSEVVKTLRQRREDMAAKDEKKLGKEKERQEQQEEEQWNINMAQCQYTLRLKPIGCDRNHSRYWVFNGAAAGVFVEQGWWNLENLPKTDEGIEDVTMASDNKQTAHEGDSDIEMVGEAKVENKMDSSVKDSLPEWRMPDISYEWSCYSTVEEVQTLIDHLSHRGIRESVLKKSLKEQLPAITDGIARRNLVRKPTEPAEEGPFSSIKEELKDTAERLVYGNLAVLEEGLEEYQNAVDQGSTISELASQLEKLLPAVLPQFFQGLFTKDKKGSEEAKQRWVDEAKKAATVSRLHLLLEILDSTVIWDLSAENARCKICRLKGVGTTLILCDDCNLGYHLQCLRPALSEVPEGHWSCPVCKPNERQSSRTSAKNYKEESGSEVDDEEASEASIDDDSDESSEDESDEHEDYCHTCGEDGDLICCDTCPLVFHKDCHQPPLRNVPRGAWSCWQCRQPKSKKQKKNLRGGQTTKSKEAKHKSVKHGRSNKLKRPHSRSSEESGTETVSKRTRQSRHPIEIADEKGARGKRSRSRAFIEDMSDEESIDGKMKASKTKQRAGKVVKRGRISTRLQRMCRQDSDDDDEEGKADNSNVTSFYGKSTRRTRQQKVSSEEDDDDELEEQSTNQSRNRGRGTRRNRPHISDDSEDEDEDESGKENRQSSRRKNVNRSKSSEKPTRKSTRNQRHVPSSPEHSEDSDEDTSQLTNQRATRNKNTKRSKNISSSFDETDESGHDTSKRSTLKIVLHEANKGTRKTQTRRGDKNDGDESDDDKVKNKTNGKKGKGKKSELKNSSATKDEEKETRTTRRTEAFQEETKRRRVNVEMDTCEQIVRDLLLHEDSWPFTQAVNLREVPDYLELVTTPMDLGTIKEKLRSLQYPDVDSFVADVRLVFSNSDKYNESTSDVGQAGKNLEKYFDKLYKENFSNTNKKSKVQRKR